MRSEPYYLMFMVTFLVSKNILMAIRLKFVINRLKLIIVSIEGKITLKANDGDELI